MKMLTGVFGVLLQVFVLCSSGPSVPPTQEQADEWDSVYTDGFKGGMIHDNGIWTHPGNLRKSPDGTFYLSFERTSEIGLVLDLKKYNHKSVCVEFNVHSIGPWATGQNTWEMYYEGSNGQLTALSTGNLSILRPIKRNSLGYGATANDAFHMRFVFPHISDRLRVVFRCGSALGNCFFGLTDFGVATTSKMHPTSGDELTIRRNELVPNIGSEILPDEWARGHSAYAHQSDPESWVRGSATINRVTGAVTFVLQLETDSVRSGPKGKMKVTLRDESGRDIYYIHVGEIGRGGKGPGRASIQDFHGQAIVEKGIAAKVKSIGVQVQVTGSVDRLYNISSDTVIDAARIIGAIVSAN